MKKLLIALAPIILLVCCTKQDNTPKEEEHTLVGTSWKDDGANYYTLSFDNEKATIRFFRDGKEEGKAQSAVYVFGGNTAIFSNFHYVRYIKYDDGYGGIEFMVYNAVISSDWTKLLLNIEYTDSDSPQKDTFTFYRQ